MHLTMSSHIETSSGTDTEADNRLFVMFHGYGNDENEMIRILDAVYSLDDDTADTGVLARPFAASPSYLSFRGTYSRRYMGGNYWYPDGCGVEERRGECARVADAVVALLDTPLFANRRKILVGFSQGGYLSYRMVRAYPELFDAAVLLSPSFMGEEDATLDSPTRFLLAYGSQDRTIPAPDQATARKVLERTGHLTYRAYPSMGHAICDEEIADLRAFLR